MNDPATRPWRQIDLANGSFGQGVAVTPIQLAQSYAAMVNGGTLVQPRVVKAVGEIETMPISRGRVLTEKLSATLKKLMKHVVTEVDFYRDSDAHPGLRGRWQDRHRPDLGRREGAWKVNLFNYSFVGYIGRDAGHPDLVVAVRIEEGTPTVVRQGHLEMPVMSFELFRRIAHNAINTPDLLPEEPGEPPRPRPRRDRGLCDTRHRDEPRTVARSRFARSPRRRRPDSGLRSHRLAEPDGPSLSADDLVAATGGRLLRRSARPVRGGAVDSRAVTPGALFVALRASGPTDIATSTRRLPPAPRRSWWGASRTPMPARPALGRWATSPSSSSPTRSARSTRWRRPGAAASSRSSWGSPGASPRPPPRRRSRPSWRAGSRRCAPRGTRTTRWACRSRCSASGPEHDAAVLEMGMYVGGEIRDLAAIGLPSIGIVTAVQPVHLSRIGTVEAIVDAKAELLEALPSAADGGVAILNADDPLVRCMAGRTRRAGRDLRLLADADVRAEDVVSSGFAGHALPPGDARGERAVAIPTLGRLAVHNALAAVAAGLAAGLDLDELLPGLAARSTAPHRSVVVRAGGVVIVDDTYNASPGSVRGGPGAARRPARPRIAVLGEMRELGSAHDAGHRAVGEVAGDVLDLLVVVDGGPGGAAEGSPMERAPRASPRITSSPSRTRPRPSTSCDGRLAPGDVVLVKASRGVELERVVDGLVAALGGPEAGA